MTSSTSDPDPPSLNPRIYTTAQLEQIAAEFLWMDRNAKYLAGAILMPVPLFEAKAGEFFNRLKPGRFDSPMTMHVAVIEQLADLFQASQLSAGIRFQHLGLDRRLRLP